MEGACFRLIGMQFQTSKSKLNVAIWKLGYVNYNQNHQCGRVTHENCRNNNIDYIEYKSLEMQNY